MTKLPKSFYVNEYVVSIAKELLGKVLVTNFNDVITSGLIVETEAYRGPDDKACHAYNNKRTPRTEVMFSEGGVSYVYLIYGIHHLFNVVTGPKDKPHAVLIRAIEPMDGISTMLNRRGHEKLSTKLTAGPGVLSKALGITTKNSNLDLSTAPIWIENRAIACKDDDIIASPRVGVDYAGADALRPWRFRIKQSKWTSPAK